jgi:hypothetical protein
MILFKTVSRIAERTVLKRYFVDLPSRLFGFCWNLKIPSETRTRFVESYNPKELHARAYFLSIYAGIQVKKFVSNSFTEPPYDWMVVFVFV